MADVIAQMEALLASLPERMATELRIGPGVMAVLRRIADKPADPYGMHSLGALAGVRVIQHADYAAGEWRMVDQRGAEMQTGNVYEPVTAPYEPDGRPFRAVPVGCTCPLNARTCPAHGARSRQRRTDSGSGGGS